MSNLAIVIPAYKSTFLPAALDLVAAQTCKDFTLCIGGDCSSDNIGKIIDRYRDKITLYIISLSHFKVFCLRFPHTFYKFARSGLL